MKLSTITLFTCAIIFSLLCASCTKKQPDNTLGKWKQLTIPYNGEMRNIYFSSKDTGYVVCGYFYDQAAKVTRSNYLVTYDGGENWALQTFNVNNVVATNICANAGALYLEGNYTGVAGKGGYYGLYRSTDKGKTWARLDSTHFIRNLQFVNNTQGLATYSQNIYSTSNAGNTFASTASLTMGGFGNAQILNSNLIYVAGYNKMYKSTDGGSTWTTFGNAYPSLVLKMQFTDANTGYGFVDDGQDGFAGNITPHNNRLVKTTDAASTWVDVRTDLLQYGMFEGGYFVSTNQGYMATDKGIFATNDGGKTWQQELLTDNPPGYPTIYGLYVSPGGVGFAIGNNGVIFKQVK